MTDAPVIAERVCPACGQASAMDGGGPAWPLDWACPACAHVAPVRDGIALTAPALADTISGFDPADFAYLSAVETGHFWFATRRRLIQGLATRYFPAARRLIEIGCGTGNVLGALAARRSWERIVGTDMHPSGLVLARSRLPAQVELLQVDARHMPFRAAFDLVGAFDVLEHMAEDAQALRGFAAALRPGGGLMVTVPQHPSLWSAADDVAFHVRRYRLGEIERKIADAGFEIVFSSSFTALLLPLMWLSRGRSRRSARHGEEMTAARQEFGLSPRLNGLLEGINRLEIALTVRGMRWPLGGSRIVCARRGDR